MNVLTRLLIPIAVGVAAAALNYLTLKSTVTTLPFTVATREIAAGDLFSTEGANANLARIDLPNVKQLASTVLSWDDVKVLEGRPAPRTFHPRDLILGRDTELAPLELQPNPGEVAIPLSLDNIASIPELLIVGDKVGFFIEAPSEPNEPRMPLEYVGPFRLLSVGKRLSRTREEWANEGSTDGRIITIAVKLEGNQPDAKTVRLLETQRRSNYGNQGGILSLVMHFEEETAGRRL